MEYSGKELNKTFILKELKYLVVGTGRCGTVYFAKLLTSLNIPCGHESIFDVSSKENILNKLKGNERIEVSKISKLASVEEEINNIYWLKNYKELIADSSYLAVPYLSELNNTKIIHIVRNPLNVINSFVYGLKYFNDKNRNNPNFKSYYDIIYSMLPELNGFNNPLDRCAYYYVKWNKLIEDSNKVDLFFRVDKDNIEKLFEFLNIKNSNNFYSNTKSNTKLDLKQHINSYNQISNIKIRKMLLDVATKYGYLNKTYL